MGLSYLPFLNYTLELSQDGFNVSDEFNVSSVKAAISKIAANNHDRCKAFYRDYNKMVLNSTVLLYEWAKIRVKKRESSSCHILFSSENFTTNSKFIFLNNCMPIEICQGFLELNFQELHQSSELGDRKNFLVSVQVLHNNLLRRFHVQL